MGNCSGRPRLGHELGNEERAARTAIEREYEEDLDKVAVKHPLHEHMVSNYDVDNGGPIVIIVSGVVYDCTSWMGIHPGGFSVLIKHAGQDCTDVFNRMHSRKAKALLKDLRVGKLLRWKKSIFQSFANSSSISPESVTPRVAARVVDDGRMRLRIVRIIPLCVGVIRIIFACPDRLRAELGSHVDVLHKGQARQYNPCFIEETNFSIIVKRYEGGLVSTFLHECRVGGAVTVEGPEPPKFCIVGRRYKNLVLIGQGTGIIPLYTIAKSLNADVVHFIMCFRKLENVFLSVEASELPHSVRLVYCLSKGTEADAELVPGPLFCRRLDKKVLQSLNLGEVDCAIICGLDSFIAEQRRNLPKACKIREEDINGL